MACVAAKASQGRLNRDTEACGGFSSDLSFDLSAGSWLASFFSAFGASGFAWASFVAAFSRASSVALSLASVVAGEVFVFPALEAEAFASVAPVGACGAGAAAVACNGE